MTAPDDALDAWEQRLEQAESELREREARALAGDPPPEVLLAFASERDKIALERDSLAGSHDEQARARDRSALGRDVAGSGRDRSARAHDQDRDPGSLDRFASGEDRDSAAGDRGDSYDDRGRAHAAREQAAADRAHAAEDRDAAVERAGEQTAEIDGLRAALESRLVIGQAEGLLMAQHNLSPETAFQVLVRLSQQSNAKLRDLAADVVAAEARRRDGAGSTVDQG